MDRQSGYILIGTVSFILLVLLFGYFIVLLIYRKRKLEHAKEVEIMNDKFANQLLQTQLEVQQQTMQDIGREIHDNVGQQLTLASLYVQQIDHEKKYPQINDRIVGVSNIINQSLNDLRSLSKSLTDDHIAQTDFIALIKNEVDKINNTKTCIVNFNSNINSITVSYSTKSVVIRIIQEFLQNSLKHSDCSSINIEIDKLRDDISINISDDGKGFSENEISGKGIGLMNIKKRAEVIGASVSIESKPNVETKMQLLIPIN